MWRIRELRKASGLTQGELAAMAGISRQRLQEVETSDNPNMTQKFIEKLATALNVSVDELRVQKYPMTQSMMAVSDAGAAHVEIRPLRVVEVPEYHSFEAWAEGESPVRTTEMLRQRIPHEGVVLVVLDESPPTWPTLFPGDRIILDTTRHGVNSRDIALILAEGHVLLRRFLRVDGEEYWSADGLPQKRLPHSKSIDILAVVWGRDQPAKNI